MPLAGGPGATATRPARTTAARAGRHHGYQAGQPHGHRAGEATGGRTAASVSAALRRVLPYFTVVVAAIVPLTAGVYLLTTTAWTLAERAFVQHALAARPGTDRRDVTV